MMTLLNLFGIADAVANTAHTAAHADASPFQAISSMMPMLLAFGAIFYFMLIPRSY